MFVTTFSNRWFAQRAAEAAFQIKGELLGSDNAAQMNGYAAAIYGMTRQMSYWPGLEDPRKPKPFEVARFLPERINRAVVARIPELMDAGVLGKTNLHPPESDRAAFQAAKARATEAAKKLIEIALSDIDGILKPYLQGRPASGGGPGEIWASFSTPVGGLMEKRPELFRAASDFEEAMRAVWDSGQSDPAQRNIGQLMKIAWAIQGYAHQHGESFPDNIEVLFESGLLKAPIENKSVLTSRPYIYVGAGEKAPSKMNERGDFVVLYDDQATADGCYMCAFASCAGGYVRVADLEAQLRNRRI